MEGLRAKEKKKSTPERKREGERVHSYCESTRGQTLREETKPLITHRSSHQKSCSTVCTSSGIIKKTRSDDPEELK